MTHIILNDKAELKNVHIDDKTGFMRANVVFSRTGIQKYYGFELGVQGDKANDIFQVYRPPEEVFHPQALASLQSIPVTDDHPTEDVTATNFRKYARGWTGETVTQDGDFVVGKVVLTDHETIGKYKNGKKEVSVGYGIELEFKDGQTPKGESYQVIQRSIRGNHVALVDAGRCEGACRILDASGKCQDCGKPQDASCNCHGGEEMSGTPGQTPTLVSRTVDGLTIQVTDQGAQVIDKLLGQLADAKTATDTAVAALETAQKEHTKAIETKDGEIAGLKAQVPDAAALDALATARADMIARVKTILGDSYDPKGKTNAQMVKDAVENKLGADGVKDKSEDFLNGVFATMSADAAQDSSDPLRGIVKDGVAPNGGGQQHQQQAKDGKPRGRDAYLARLKAAPQGIGPQQKAS